MLSAIKNGKISGTGTVNVSSGVIGGVLISTDGTNAAAVLLQADSSAGKKIFDVSTKTPMFVPGPINIGSRTLYFSITGTGASAQLFEETFKTG